MTDIQAVFLDIDGTLVTNRKLVPSAREVVERLLRAHVHLALCTGRSIIHTLKVQKTLGINDAVYFNGSLAISEGNQLLSLPLNRQTTTRALELAHHHVWPTILHTARDTLTTAAIPQSITPLLEQYDYPEIRHITEDELHSVFDSVYQMNVFMTADLDAYVNRELPECLLYRWNERAVDLQLGGCDKSVGADAMLKHWGVAADAAVHIGDGGNDIGLFDMLGTSVAMGNAVTDVQKRATFVTDTAENHGVLKALEKLDLI